MSHASAYVNNSLQKDFIRSKWIEFAKEIYADKSHDFGIITFPAEAMQDLHLFKKEGLIDWKDAETVSEDGTPNYRVVRGNIRCFEKKASIYKIINRRLSEAKVSNDDFCAYLVANYARIIQGSDKTFPVDVVNLDFEARLYPNTKFPFDTTVNYIFEFQRKHKRDFSLFLTWPVVEQEDIQEFKDLLHNVIESNLSDPSALKFKSSFEDEVGNIDALDYERKSVIGVTKVVIKKASQNLFTLGKSEFYVYGGAGRQRMISLMYNFKYDGRTGKENIIYSTDVAISMTEVIDVNKLN